MLIVVIPGEGKNKKKKIIFFAKWAEKLKSTECREYGITT